MLCVLVLQQPYVPAYVRYTHTPIKRKIHHCVRTRERGRERAERVRASNTRKQPINHSTRPMRLTCKNDNILARLRREATTKTHTLAHTRTRADCGKVRWVGLVLPGRRSLIRQNIINITVPARYYFTVRKAADGIFKNWAISVL